MICFGALLLLVTVHGREPAAFGARQDSGGTSNAAGGERSDLLADAEATDDSAGPGVLKRPVSYTHLTLPTNREV